MERCRKKAAFDASSSAVRPLRSKKCSLLRNRSLICTFYYVSFPVLCRHLNKICL